MSAKKINQPGDAVQWIEVDNSPEALTALEKRLREDEQKRKAGIHVPPLAVTFTGMADAMQGRPDLMEPRRRPNTVRQDKTHAIVNAARQPLQEDVIAPAKATFGKKYKGMTS